MKAKRPEEKLKERGRLKIRNKGKAQRPAANPNSAVPWVIDLKCLQPFELLRDIELEKLNELWMTGKHKRIIPEARH